MSTFPAERTAIVTGAVSERGIGRATVNYLAAQGWNIGIIDLDDALLQEHRQGNRRRIWRAGLWRGRQRGR